MQITGGFLKSRKIDSPKGSNVRPTLSQVRESVFSILYSMIDFEGKNFLDLFAGSGIMGFEAISRGFLSVDFVEKDKKTYLMLKENAKKLALLDEQVFFHIGDSIKLLKKFDKTFNVIYVDPPYQGGFYDDVLKIIKTQSLLKKDGILILEHPLALNINFENYEIIKQKSYGGKTLSLLGFKN